MAMVTAEEENLDSQKEDVTMQTLQLCANEQAIQQILTNLKSLSEAGNEIEILETQSFHQKMKPDELQQNNEILTKIRKSISQMERGETYDQEDAFDMAFKRLGI